MRWTYFLTGKIKTESRFLAGSSDADGLNFGSFRKLQIQIGDIIKSGTLSYNDYIMI